MFKLAATVKRFFCDNHLVVVAATLVLVSCTVTGAGTGSGAIVRQGLLRPWIELTGASLGTSLEQPGFAGGSAGGYVMLRRPTSVSARRNAVYLIDEGLRRLYRYDHNQHTLTPFTSLTTDAEMSIYVAPDLSVYVTDPVRRQVLHFAWDGTPLPSLSLPDNLGRPISVVVDAGSGQVLVADGLYDQIIAFSNLGSPLSIIKPSQVKSIAAMTQGPDGIYIVDRLARQVVVVGRDGAYRYAFGAGTLSEPVSIAVSRGNLVFVGDNFDQSIKVYKAGKQVATVGGIGAEPGRFSGIAGLSVDENRLYVADSLNARVQIMLINPQALNTGKGE